MNNNIYIANLKMNGNIQLIDKYINLFKNYNGNELIILCPPFTLLDYSSNKIKTQKSILTLGAQNIHHETEGPYTGEISANLIKSYSKYSIIGHSERRLNGETNEIITKKIISCLKNNIKPILCVGEYNYLDNANETFKIIEDQLTSLKNIVSDSKLSLLIAYEPVWAIGNNNSCDPDRAGEIANFIKGFVASNTNNEINILYGGSVDDKNHQGYLKQKNINGLLVGTASLDPTKFYNIVNNNR
ncbi:MAG: triosephosphate isomerase [SAR202 cluster bacterium]|nr:triosephosphate isomerase [SAR202 cluster bacterium]